MHSPGLVQTHRLGETFPINPTGGSMSTNPIRAALIPVAVAVAALTQVGCATQGPPAATFTLSSPDLASGRFDNAYVLNGFGCKGGNISPALMWKNPPAGTKSFALQVHDPDAPTGSGFWHWAVYNIPAAATGLPRGAGNAAASLPAPAMGGATDFQDTGATGGNGHYGGPCPPQGDADHHYVFTLYALAVDNLQGAAGIPPTGTAALHSFVLNKGIGKGLLGKASFTAVYKR
jgi:Raf kinase inhibitor-like YbhB/YbcL family protein